jgi:hypothetical protein
MMAYFSTVAASTFSLPLNISYCEFSTAFITCGIATNNIIDNITITASSSINVNPFFI